MEINHLSYSSISLYQRCPRKWKFRYIEKVPTKASEALAFGGAIHNTIEDYLRSGGDLLAIWESRWVEKSRDEEVDFDAQTDQALFQQGLEMLQSEEILAGLNTIRPAMADDQPLIEKKVTLAVDDVPLPVIGYVDIITADQLPGDFKTSQNRWSESKAGQEIQPLFYLAALEQEGHALPEWSFNHYVLTKGKYQFQNLRSTFQPQQKDWLFEMIRNVWRGIEAGVFFENPTSDWACSEKFCEYWAFCRGKYA